MMSLPARPRTVAAAFLALALVLGVLVPINAQAVELPSSTLRSRPSQAKTLQWGNIYLAAQVADISYHDDEDVRRRALADWGLDQVRFFDGSGDTQVLVAEDRQTHDFVFIGFRGTESARDVIRDLNVTPVAPSWNPSISTHAGFTNAAEAAYGAVVDAVTKAEREGKTVFLTGHSLGGAIAHLTALRLDRDGHAVHSVYTFGAPKAGNLRYVEEYNGRLGSRTHDFRNEQDPMPCVPTRVDRWESEVGWHYHVKPDSLNVVDDDRACIGQLVTSPSAAVEAVTGVCARTARGWRRLARVFVPHCIGGAPSVGAGITGGIGVLGSSWVGHHRMAKYLDHLRRNFSPDALDSALVRRPVEMREVNLDGTVGGVTNERLGTGGWTGSTSWISNGRLFHAKTKASDGLLRIQEIHPVTGATVREVVDDEQVGGGLDVIGTIGAGPSHVVLFGGGNLSVRALNADFTIGREIDREVVLENAWECVEQQASGAPLDRSGYPWPPACRRAPAAGEAFTRAGLFTPDRAVVFDADGPSGPRPAQVVMHEWELGEYRVRAIGTDGQIQPTAWKGSVGDRPEGGSPARYEMMETYWVGLHQYLLFVAFDGTSEIRRVAADGNPGERVQYVAPGEGTPHGYVADRGWTSVTTFGQESGEFALFHDIVGQDTWVYTINRDGTLGRHIDDGDWHLGWTSVEAIQAPGKVLLYGVRQ